MNHVRGPSARPRGTALRRRGEAIDAGHEALNNVRLHAGSDASDPGRPAQCRVALVFEGGAVRVTITDTGAASTRTGQPGCATGSATPSWPGWRRSGQGVPGLVPRRGDAGRPGVERPPGQAGQTRTCPGRAREEGGPRAQPRGAVAHGLGLPGPRGRGVQGRSDARGGLSRRPRLHHGHRDPPRRLLPPGTGRPLAGAAGGRGSRAGGAVARPQAAEVGGVGERRSGRAVESPGAHPGQSRTAVAGVVRVVRGRVDVPGAAPPAAPAHCGGGRGVRGPRRGHRDMGRRPGKGARARVHLLLGPRRHLRLLADPHIPVGRCDDRYREGPRGRGRGAPGARGAADAQRRHGRRTRRLRPGRVLARSARPQGTATWPGAVPTSSSTTTPFEFTTIVGPSVAATTTAVPA